MLTFASARSLPIFLVCAFLLCALTLPTHAATLYVSPDGNDNNSGTVTSPYKTIQAAVDNASDGDSVTLKDGIYSGIGDRDIDLKGKSFTVNSVHSGAKAIIDCGGTKQDHHHAFYAHNKETATLSGLMIENGYDFTGGAVDIEPGSSMKMIDCVLANNVSPSSNTLGGGGGIFNRGKSDVINCIFTKNNDTFTEDVNPGGAIYNDGILILKHCVFTDNTAVRGNGRGGAVYNTGEATITSSQFSGNKAHTGGAICSNNTMIISGSTFSNNTADDTNGSGGAVKCTNTMTLSKCVLTSNSANSGGAIDSNSTLILNDCILSGNTARAGGAIRNSYVGEDIIILNGCDIINNNAVKGGGIYVGAGAILTNCIFAGNTTHPDSQRDASNGENIAQGGGIFRDWGTPQFKLVLRFCSFSGNTAQGPNSQGGAIENDGKAVFTNVILWGNTAVNEEEIGIATKYDPTTTVTYSDIQGGLSGTGNLKINPGFIDAGGGNLHLQAGSPCRGAGIAILPTKADPKQYNSKPDPGVITDADGNKRPNPPSIGAYEYSTTAPAPRPKPILDSSPIVPDGPTDASPSGGNAVPEAAASATTEAAVPPATPGPKPKLWPGEQQKYNAELLQLMATLNTDHYSMADMAQKIQAVLDKGADINAKDSAGFPAIVTAASLAHTDVVQVLIEHGANVNLATDPPSKSSTTDSNSILHKMAGGGYQIDLNGAIAGLFGKKPKPLSGQTALMFANLTGQSEMVTLLLAHGADSHLKDSRGKTAADYAAQNQKQ